MATDPTVPTATIETADGPVTICLDFGVLMDAEERLIAAGHRADLMHAMSLKSASGTRTFFAVAGMAYQTRGDEPGARRRTFDDLRGLVTAANIGEINARIMHIWLAAMPKAKKDDGDAPDPPMSSDAGESTTGSTSSPSPESTADSVSQN